jgi:hypothetical protein
MLCSWVVVTSLLMQGKFKQHAWCHPEDGPSPKQRLVIDKLCMCVVWVGSEAMWHHELHMIIISASEKILEYWLGRVALFAGDAGTSNRKGRPCCQLKFAILLLLS